MSPAFLLIALLAGLVALVPVWRLAVAGWPPRWLLTTWVVLAVVTFIAVRFPGPVRFVVPILVLAYVAPFVAGPERLSRVLGRRRRPPGVVIDVTPLPRANDADSRPPGDGGDEPRGNGRGRR